MSSWVSENDVIKPQIREKNNVTSITIIEQESNLFQFKSIPLIPRFFFSFSLTFLFFSSCCFAFFFQLKVDWCHIKLFESRMGCDVSVSMCRDFLSDKPNKDPWNQILVGNGLGFPL